MYHYIYDSFLSDKRYENEISQIEARILGLGINGRVDKLTILKNLKEIVEDGIKKGAETLVVMGGGLQKQLSWMHWTRLIKALKPEKGITSFCRFFM